MNIGVFSYQANSTLTDWQVPCSLNPSGAMWRFWLLKRLTREADGFVRQPDSGWHAGLDGGEVEFSAKPACRPKRGAAYFCL